MDFDDLPDPHLPIFGGLNAPRARRDRLHADVLIVMLIPIGRQSTVAAA